MRHVLKGDLQGSSPNGSSASPPGVRRDHAPVERARIADRITRSLRDLFRFDDLCLFWRGDGDAVAPFWSDAAPSALAPGLEARTSLAASVVLHPNITIVDSREQVGAFPLTAGQFQRKEFESALLVPLFGAERALGALGLHSRVPGAFRSSEARALAELGPAIAATIRGALLEEELPIAARPRRADDLRAVPLLVGASPAWEEVKRLVSRVAAFDVPVLVTGETGTGKEVVARAIHQLGKRPGAPFVAVNCGAVAPSLFESELFGHERGAFTGAVGRHAGRFESAAGGTLFLDEIGELGSDLQAKLLRALAEGEYEAVGASSSKRLEARVVAATNRNLDAEMRRREFRADLFYRLSVVRVELPPLRARRTDIPLLVDHFLAILRAQYGLPLLRVTPEDMARLLDHPWPGNVRELRNVLEGAALLAGADGVAPIGATLAAAGTAPEAEGIALAHVQRRHIREVLATCHGVIEGRLGAARALGMPPSTLRSLMRRLGLDVRKG